MTPALTPKQERALSKAPKSERARMRKAFQAQLWQGKPSETRRKQISKGEKLMPKSGRILDYAPDIFDPRNLTPPPTLASEGLATHIHDKLRFGLSTSNKRVLLAVGPGASDSNDIGCLQVNVAGTPIIYAWAFPKFTTAGTTSFRPCKLGISLQNYTKQIDLGGRLYVLAANQRLSVPTGDVASMTEANWDALTDQIISHPDTIGFSCRDFVEKKTFCAYPSSQADYLTYLTQVASNNDRDDYWRVITHTDLVIGKSRGMSTIWIVFELSASSTDFQDFEVTIRKHWYARYPTESLLSNMSRPIPTASSEHINRHRDHAERMRATPRLGDTLLEVSGIGPTFRDTKRTLQKAWQHRDDIRSGLAAAYGAYNALPKGAAGSLASMLL